MSSEEPDFVIVGGGTAGIALAARLTEDAANRVLVLEAGQDLSQDPRVTTPALWPSLLGTDAAWDFTTVPQAEIQNRSLPIPGGKMIGGSSGLNGCAFIANSKSNVDAWASIGNPGWTWDDMVPYYKKAYTLNLPSIEIQKELHLDYVDPKIHGSGPIQLSFPDAINDPVAKAWVKSLQGLGFPMKTDPFSGSATGGYINAAIVDPIQKTRSYAGNSYYESAKDRSNLEVKTGVQVRRIILEATSNDLKRAVGAEYAVDGQIRTVKAKREVIVSSGTLNSPKLLEMSGIGKKEVLDRLGIDTLIDLPGVGENLQDHFTVGISFQIKDEIETKDEIRRKNPQAIAAAMEAYQESRTGSFTVGGDYSSALLPVPEYLTEQGKAELEEILSKVPVPPQGSFEKDLYDYALGAARDTNEANGGYFFYAARAQFKGPNTTTQVGELFESPDTGNWITILARIMNPLSRGSIHAASKDPDAAPVIDPRWLTHPLDLELLARHVRYIDEIAATKAIKEHLKEGGGRTPGIAPDFRKVPLDEVKDYVKTAGVTSWHLTGTCSMMPKAKGGVVDPQLRVYGSENLRVVDASIIPICPRANSQSSAYAVAEKAADLIMGRCNGAKAQPLGS